MTPEERVTLKVTLWLSAAIFSGFTCYISFSERGLLYFAQVPFTAYLIARAVRAIITKDTPDGH